MKKFKEGDRVKILGHPVIKGEIIGEVHSLLEYLDGEIGFYIKFELMPQVLEINSKYLEKVEDWLLFETTRDIYPLASIENDLDKESRLYNYMYQWKEKFDPEEVDWENNGEKWYISKNFGDWCTDYIIFLKQNLQIYFTTEEKAEQCLEWLKKEGVLY